MPSIIHKAAIRKDIEKGQPKLVSTATFSQGPTHATCFSALYQAMGMHFGEIELVARRAYERGYDDGKSGRKPRDYKDL